VAPLSSPPGPRRLGLFEGEPFWMSDDFDELPDDMLAAFEGEE